MSETRAPYKAIPADGDDYTWVTPFRRENGRTVWQPEIPPQWVPVGEYRALCAEVARLAVQVAELRRIVDEQMGDP